MITEIAGINLCGKPHFIQSMVDIAVINESTRLSGWLINHLIEVFTSHKLLKHRIFKCILIDISHHCCRNLRLNPIVQKAKYTLLVVIITEVQKDYIEEFCRKQNC